MFKRNTKKYGRYKINCKASKEQMNDLFYIIRKGTEIKDIGKGSVRFKLKDSTEAIDYAITNFTNVKELTGLDIENIIKSSDKDLIMVVANMRMLVKFLLECYKEFIIKKSETILNSQKRVEELIK